MKKIDTFHGCSESVGDGVKVESDAEVAVHVGFVEDAGVVLVQLEDGLVLASPEEFARISKVSGVAEWSRSKMRLDGFAP
jgi:hypothetical protein